MLIPPGKLKYSDEEHRAFRPVLDAIEDSMGYHDMQPEYRAVLAELHTIVGQYIGIKAVRGPDDWAREKKQRQWEEHELRWSVQRGPGGIDELRRLLDCGVRAALSAARFDTVFELDEATDAELLAIKGIGSGRVAAIRDAIARWRDVNAADLEPEPAPERKPQSERARLAELSKGPDGTDQLVKNGWITPRTWFKLLRLKIVLIADLEQADHDGILTPENKIGPRVLLSIRVAISLYREQHRELPA